jgi:hypothetical protein
MFAVQDRLMKAYVITGKLQQAAQVACEFALQSTHPRMFLRAASLCASGQDRSKCLEILKRGMERFPDSSELRQALAEVVGHTHLGNQSTLEIKDLQVIPVSNEVLK